MRGLSPWDGLHTQRLMARSPARILGFPREPRGMSGGLEFEAVYEERYQERYGFWRPIIGTVVRKFLECGDLKHGFARACLCRTADRSAAPSAAPR